MTNQQGSKGLDRSMVSANVANIHAQKFLTDAYHGQKKSRKKPYYFSLIFYNAKKNSIFGRPLFTKFVIEAPAIIGGGISDHIFLHRSRF